MARIVINKGKPNERTVPLEFETTTVGRATDNVVVLPELYVSRQHLIIEKRPAGYFLHNLSSTTGTVVNQKKVDEVQLKNGDVIAVGETTLHFEIEPTDERTMLLEQPTVVMATPPEPPAASPSVCPKCKNKVRPDDVFCGSCGASLKAPAPAPAPPSRPPAPPAPPAGAAPPPPRAATPAPGAASPPSSPRVPPLTAPPMRPSAPMPPRPATHGAMRPAAGTANYLNFPKAGFGVRLLAYIIDSIILSVIGFVLVGLPFIIFMSPAIGAGISQRSGAAGALGALGFLVMMAGMLVYMVVVILYILWYWARRGYTPGKKMMGLRIITQSGQCPLGWGTACVRFIGYIISGMIAYVGFLLILVDAEKRGLHDMIAKTYVVKIK